MSPSLFKYLHAGAVIVIDLLLVSKKVLTIVSFLMCVYEYIWVDIIFF